MFDFEVAFDSRNEKYRKPAGALLKGSALELAIEVSGFVNVTKAEVVILYDRHKEPAYYCMEKVSEGEKSLYRTSFPVFDTGLYWYYFQITTDLGYHRIGRAHDNRPVILNGDTEADKWQLTVYSRDFNEPEWLYGGIYYQIFVDRFNRSEDSGRLEIDDSSRMGLPPKTARNDWGGMPEYLPVNGRICNNDFFGGNLKGIQEKLPYLAQLGVTCIYLSPVFEAYSNHKYDTGNYLHIDPYFGTEEDFTALCSAADEMGIKVILDGVFSHTGSDSLYFDKYGNYGGSGAWNNTSSPYRDWYSFDDKGNYLTWWGIDTLPRVRKENPEFRRFIAGEDGVVQHWIKQGAYGWRLDVVDELPSDFTAAVCQAARDIKADAVMIGEVWEDASNKAAYEERKNYFEGDKLNSVMNYPLKEAIIDFVRHGKAWQLAEVVEGQLENYPAFAIHSMMNLLGSHDSVRILTALAGKELPADAPRSLKAETFMTGDEKQHGIRLLKLASLIQMTIPGIPCIYYGDEAGMEGYADPFNRRCFPWGHENSELQDWYKLVTRIRREHNVYRKGTYHTRQTHPFFFAFDRTGEGECIITAVNCSDTDAAFDLDGTYVDLLTGDTYAGCISISPYTGLLLVQRFPQ